MPEDRASDVMVAAAQFACLAPPDGRQMLPATCALRIAQAFYSADPSLLASLGCVMTTLLPLTVPLFYDYCTKTTFL